MMMSTLSDIDIAVADTNLGMGIKGENAVVVPIIQMRGSSQKMEYGHELDYIPIPVLNITTQALQNTIELINTGVL